MKADMASIGLEELEGGPALCAWFGSRPSFHDAKLSKLEICQGADSVIVAHIFQAGPEIDGDDYFVQAKHAAVTFVLSGLIEVTLYDFMEAGIMDGLDIDRDAEGTTLSFDASYGVHGRIKAKRVSLSFAPEQREAG
jgi:hypothetical protein